MAKESATSVAVHTEDLNIETAVKMTVGLDTAAQAKQGAQAEHELTVREAIRKYPRALFWSLMVSMCVVMEGYDTNLLSNFYAYPAFAKQYGTFNEATNNYQLSAPWQAGLGNAAGIGAFFGTLLNGYLVTKWGHVRVLIGALISLSCTIFIVFFAPNTGVMLAGQILCGLPWGIFATAAPGYASEVLPMTLRVYLTSYTNVR
jgi:SP family general alpha glucoside:H+ symporter-like MFS transporter